jgi:hypothetical protein
MTARPDTTSVLAGLKDFQRATVNYVFERFYGEEPTRRFLVADEVGLGKTLVARGVIRPAECPAACHSRMRGRCTVNSIDLSAASNARSAPSPREFRCVDARHFV